MGKQYNSIRAMIKDSDADAEFKDKAVKEIENRQLSKFLVVLRCKYGLTQKQMADKMGCTQSRVSKIESSYDTELSIKDLLDYGRVLNLKLEVGYRKASIKIVDLIKYHAFKMNHYLNQLVALTKYNEDDSIEKGVEKFFKEVLFNINALVLEPYSNLTLPGKGTARDKKLIHISEPMDTSTDKKIHSENTRC